MFPRTRLLTFLFGLFLFFQCAASAPGIPLAASGIAVLPVAKQTFPSLLTTSTVTTGFFTTTTAIPLTAADGKTTLSTMITVLPTTVITVVPVQTGASNMDSFIPSAAWISPSNLPGAQQWVLHYYFCTKFNSQSPSVHKQTIRIAVSISVVGFILAISLVLLVLWRRRRRSSERNSGIRAGAKFKRLPVPFKLTATDVDSEARGNRVNKPTIPQASDAISTRQVYISNQVNRAREKVAELEAETSTLLRQSSRSSHQGSIPPETGDISQTPDDSNSPANDQRLQLERAIRQIEELNGRIRDLERQRRSSWALGLSDAPPPGYIE
ncbi:hypothetical protein C8R46DRAFT_1231582 [Mycena filopes]|nr:hypothetical protein C8R46DRAFT_1231582 [Mycena filopes]